MKLAVNLGIVYVVWGSTYLAIAVADRSLPPFLMLSVRFLIAGGLLWAWCSWRGELRAARPGVRQWGAAAVVGGALLVLDTGGVAWAEQRVSSGIAALMVATVALFMALLDRTLFGVRLPRGAAAGIGVGLFGVALLVGPSGHVDALGAIVLLGASFAWAAGSAYARVAPLPQAPLVSASMQMLCAGALLGIVGVADGERLAGVSAASFGAVAYLVVFGSLVAFTAYGWLLKHAPTPILSTYAYVNPAVAVLLGWLFAGEQVGGREVAAGVVILSSVAMLALARDERAGPAPVAEALPSYIRAQEARVAEVRSVPRLVDLHRVAC
jgi:drug/metabolite transporter (DMT)-like permease